MTRPIPITVGRDRPVPTTIETDPPAEPRPSRKERPTRSPRRVIGRQPHRRSHDHGPHQRCEAEEQRDDRTAQPCSWNAPRRGSPGRRPTAIPFHRRFGRGSTRAADNTIQAHHGHRRSGPTAIRGDHRCVPRRDVLGSVKRCTALAHADSVPPLRATLCRVVNTLVTKRLVRGATTTRPPCVRNRR